MLLFANLAPKRSHDYTNNALIFLGRLILRSILKHAGDISEQLYNDYTIRRTTRRQP